MKEEESKILSKLGKEPGFKTPENYFSDFQNNIAEKLPNFSVSEEKVKPNLWVRFRPYVYMAAMFAGIFCMMKMFDMMRSPNSDLNIDNYPAVTAAINSGELDNVIMNGVDDNDIIESLYETGFSAEEIYTYEDSIDMNDTIIE